MKTLTTSTNPTAEDDRRLGRLRHQGLRLPLGLRPLLVGRRLGHNIWYLAECIRATVRASSNWSSESSRARWLAPSS
jgi:hypothetical protein